MSRDVTLHGFQFYETELHDLFCRVSKLLPQRRGIVEMFIVEMSTQ